MKVLLINGYETYNGIGENRLNKSLITYTKDILEMKNYEVSVQTIENGYDVKDEHDKFVEADIIFIQAPVYWFGVPAILKGYIDQVLMKAVQESSLLSGDGRSRNDISKKYGSGGLASHKKYMLSTTWNAPSSIFDNKDEFYEGLSMDDSMATIHKSFQFCGFEKLPSFAIYDVFKTHQDTINEQIIDFKNHIKEVF